MRNTYRVKGNKVYITIPAANGRIPLPETEVAIDLKNLEKIQAFPGNWVQSIHPVTGKLFVRGWYSKGGQIIRPYLSKYIAQPGIKEQTRHIDGDQLNCLESNLVNVPMWIKDLAGLTPIGAPLETLKKPEPQEPLKPVKGVSWHKVKRKWEVKPYYQGKRQCIGYWPEWQLSEANEAAEYVREYGPEAYKAKIEGGK